MIALCLLLLYFSTIESLALVLRQVAIFATMVLIDTIMLSVETPLLAFTMETFRKKDRQFVITALPMFGGAGNITSILGQTSINHQTH